MAKGGDLNIGGGGGVYSEDVTSNKSDVLKGTKTVMADSDDEIVEGTLELTGNAGDDNVLAGSTYYNTNAKSKRTGTMSNRGNVSQSLNAGGSYTIPKGYHNGSGKVTANSLASQTGGATTNDGDVLTGKTYWKDGTKRTGTMANRGAISQALNAGSSYTVPAGYHNGSGKVTANNLSSQTSANSGAGDIRSGKTAWVNGSKITGSLTVQSAISFSAAALSYNTIRISWKNPAKGPWQGVFIQMSTSGYPGTGGGSRVYTGTGTNPNQAGGNNYVDIGGLTFGTTYYFTCTSYCDAFGWGASSNISTATINASLGTPIILDENGYLPLLELDSTRVVGMKTYNPPGTSKEFVVDLSIMSSGKNGLSILGTASKTFSVNKTMSKGDHISAFKDVSVLRYSENGFYLVYEDNVKDYAYIYLIKVTTTSNTITIHDMNTHSCTYGHYNSVSNNPGYDFTSTKGEYSSTLISIQYYEDETDDVSDDNYKTISIGSDGTITDLNKYGENDGTVDFKHDNRMLGGGSRFLNYRVTGNYEINYRGFKARTSGGLYLNTNHEDTAALKDYNAAYTSMPNNAPYALISVPDGVYAYKDSNLWNYPVLSNPDASASNSSDRRYIKGIALNADMDRLAVLRTSTRSGTSTNANNDIKLYRFNRSNMTAGALLDTYSFVGSVYGIRACGQGICIIDKPNYSDRSTKYISI